MVRRKPAYLRARDQLLRPYAKKSQENIYVFQHSCDQCEFVGKTERALELHKVVHQKERPLFCEICDYPANRKSDLTHHFQQFHTYQQTSQWKPVVIPSYSVLA